MKKLLLLIFLGLSISGISQNVGIGIASPQFKLDVRAGSINTDSLYRIGSQPVLSVKGSHNLFVGEHAGRQNTANENTFVGDSAGMFNQLGYANAFLGNHAGFNNTNGVANTAIGSAAMGSNTTGSYNIVLGYGALASNQTGNSNVAVGTFSLQTSTSSHNTAVGYAALLTNSTGDHNTAIGNNSLYSNATGAHNSAMGEGALFNNAIGSLNTAYGSGALYTNTSGNYNTALGYNANVNPGNLFNVTAIGANALATSSNSLVLGSISGVNGAISNARIGIGVTNPGAKLHVVSTEQYVSVFDGPQDMYIVLNEEGSYRGYIGSYSGNAQDVDFGTGAGTTGSVHLAIQGVPKLTVTAAGTVNIDSELNRSSKTGAANLLPVCYGNIVGSTGAISASTGNFTFSRVSAGTYEITITGETYHFQQFVAVVNTIGVGAPVIASTSSGSGKLLVYLTTPSATLVDATFNFIVYKP
jgi:hypothetical protein